MYTANLRLSLAKIAKIIMKLLEYQGNPIQEIVESVKDSHTYYRGILDYQGVGLECFHYNYMLLSFDVVLIH